MAPGEDGGWMRKVHCISLVYRELGDAACGSQGRTAPEIARSGWHGASKASSDRPPKQTAIVRRSRERFAVISTKNQSRPAGRAVMHPAVCSETMLLLGPVL